MNYFGNTITFLIGSFVVFFPIKKVITGKWNIFHLCCISFYIMQIVPIAIKNFFGTSQTLEIYPKMYLAMTDKTTELLYNLFVISIIIILYFMSYRIPTKRQQQFHINKKNRMKRLSTIFGFGMFSILIGVFFAPKPQIYFSFSYFYTHHFIESEPIYLYHKTYMLYFSLLTFLCIMLFYLLNPKKHYTYLVYIAIFLMTWINGKRTMMTLALIGILFIDIKKETYSKKMLIFIFKTLFFVGIIFWYFIFYGNETGKMSSLPFTHLYSIYFARMSNVEVSIYDKLYDNDMMDYTGQSVLYDLFFWIPRSLWKNKPVLYSKYHTVYVMGYDDVFTNWQFQTNIWSEYISNFGILGSLIAVFVLFIIVWISENSRSKVVYLSGMLFSVLYTMYGFESILQYIGIFWIIAVLTQKYKIKL